MQTLRNATTCALARSVKAVQDPHRLLRELSHTLRPNWWVVRFVLRALACYGAVRLLRWLHGVMPQQWRQAIKARVALWRTEFVSWIGNRVTKRYDSSVRGVWTREMQLTTARPAPGHSHGVSAANRTAASRLIDEFAHHLGRVIYVVSSCSRDSADNPTYHQWFMGKDAAFVPRNDPVPANAVIKMVDVDYYINWAHWIRYRVPVAIYTFVPDDVLFSNQEYSYALTPDGVNMHVSGGREYEHQLWDYSIDHVLVWDSWFSWTLCSVDNKMVDRHHRLVLVNPICTVDWIGFLLPERGFRRLSFDYGIGIANAFRAEGGDMLSIGLRNGGRAITTTTLPLALWKAIQIRISTSKHPGISDVERYLKVEKIDGAAVGAPPLYMIARSLVEFPAMKVIHAAGNFSLVRYQAVDGLTSEDGKEIGRAVAPSLVTNPDFVPNRSYNNDLASITGRVDRVLSDVVPPDRYSTYAVNFVSQLVRNVRGTGCPLSISEVVDIQNRPTQRGRSDKVLQWIGRVNPVDVKAFMKGESYSKPTDPRNISTVGAEHTLRMSAYTYAFKRDVLYPLSWYAPGKQPKTVAARIVDIAGGYGVVSETDFSRFDGTISMWLRTNIERAVYLQWVSNEHRMDLGLLLAAEINPRARTSNGLAYEPRASRLSGSPLTTDGNTLINAFVSYAAGREARMSHDEAWEILGLYAGDDGVSPIKPQYLERAASCLGLKLKCERRSDGNLTFLGRVFYGARDGELGSIQDPLRTWRKLHISFATPNFTDNEALANRAKGYRVLDPNAPVVSDWCAKIKEFTGLEGIVDDSAPYFARLQLMDEEFGGWPQLSYERGLEAIAWREDTTVESVMELVFKIRGASRLGELAELWSNVRAEPTIPVVIAGEVLDPLQSEGSIRTEPFEARKPLRRNVPSKRTTAFSGRPPARGNKRVPRKTD